MVPNRSYWELKLVASKIARQRLDSILLNYPCKNQEPVRLIEHSMPRVFKFCRQESLVYWQPQPPRCRICFPSGLRASIA